MGRMGGALADEEAPVSELSPRSVLLPGWAAEARGRRAGVMEREMPGRGSERKQTGPVGRARDEPVIHGAGMATEEVRRRDGHGGMVDGMVEHTGRGSETGASPSVASGRIFCNRSLNMSDVEAVGFDMDHTLATYTAQFDHLAFRLSCNRLVDTFGYPQAVNELVYDPHFMMRGVVLDKELGNALKINRNGYVKLAKHGTRHMSKEQRQRTLIHRTACALFQALADSCLFASPPAPAPAK